MVNKQKSQLNIRRSQQVVSLLVFSFIFLIILTSSSQERIISQGSVQAAGNESAVDRPADALLLSDQSVANCRYGLAVQYELEAHVARLGAGMFLDFNPPRPIPVAGNNAEFVHVFKVFQQKTEDGQYLPAYIPVVPLGKDFAVYLIENPGGLWLIGNEVDRGPNPGEITSGQGDMYPEIYAVAYHEVRAFIKKYDPTARTGISGLVQVTPSRLRYLDRVWDAYEQQYGTAMPVDVWNMHDYILPEVEPDGMTPNGIANIPVGVNPILGKKSSGGDPQVCAAPDVYCFAEHDDLDIFAEQIVAMRQWMKEHGQQQKPLILSEFSILYPYIDEGETCFLQDEYGDCFTPDRVASFMSNTFALLNDLKNEDLGYGLDENRLVQQWVWFSMYTDRVGTVSNILQSDKQTLSLVGETFQQTVFAEPPLMNLLIESVPDVAVPVDHESGRATARLQVNFRNNGNTAVDTPFIVTFYSDQAQTQEIGSLPISEAVRGCTTNRYKAVVEWPDLSPGQYPFWVTIDSGDVIAETPPGRQDNFGSGMVVVYPESSFVPIIAR